MSEQANPENSKVAPSAETSPPDDEINLLDLVIVLAKHKRVVIGVPVVAAILAAIVSMLSPNIYTATTKILPPQQSQSAAAAMLNQLSGLAGLAGSAGGLKNPNDVYLAMLKSRTLADNLVQRFGLMKLLEFKFPSDARQWLEGKASIKSGLDGIITVEVDDEDPKRAAEFANAYIEELFKMTNVLAVTEASQRRLFFEHQLATAKDNLAKAEGTARHALEQGGLVKVDDQGRAMVETTARLRGQITVKEIQIGAMRTFATEQNPELQRAQRELESMKHELAKIEGSGGVRTASKGKNDQGMESLRLLRDIKYYETLYELLAKQYELAKIDEAKDSAVIQVMDKAVEPDRKSKPNRRNIVLISALAGLFAGILWAFVRETTARVGSDPEQAKRLQILKRYLAWRRTA